MKFSHICILALVCFAAINAQAEVTAPAPQAEGTEAAPRLGEDPRSRSPVPPKKRSESSKSGEVSESGKRLDDWSESTDVINRHRTVEGSHSISKSNSWKNATGKYIYKKGDVVQEYTITDGKAATSTSSVKTPVTRIVDGKIVTTYETDIHVVDKHRRVIKVARFWNTTKHVESVTDIILAFSKTISPLTQAEYDLVNTLATTDTNRLWSDYNYWQVRDMNIADAVTQISYALKTTLSAADIAAIAQQIKICTAGYISIAIDSSSIDVNNQNGWTIHAEYLAATCGANSTQNQIFAWVGSKQGEYLPGAFSQANAHTLSLLIKRWLFTHVGMLVTCTQSPVKPMHIWNHKKVVGAEKSKSA